MTTTTTTTRTFPNETPEYRAARTALLEKEAELAALTRSVVAERQRLPPGGAIKDDYVFHTTSGTPIKLSDLFAKDKGSSLVIYSMMFPDGKPCPHCTNVVNGLEGVAATVGATHANFVVVAKAPHDQVAAYAAKMGWKDLTLLSSAGTTFNADYYAEEAQGARGGAGGQNSLLTVFRKLDDGSVHHHWTSEMAFKDNDESSFWPVYPLFGIINLTVEGDV
ncbi:uncharacterized protein EHS24_005498 [Apiotrichum porosum]|uniref:Thioredoxin domain-containing protein n=1 Tax=Apiotrichum porosum TaxID=105984 RepID=A0A427XCX7_9TREE|nr:uncharacterized protein EHS24_005498 [Apiotrichum porosum]RSH76613.1 hypothetical protein EHS24_005498 [Apiotrichum porosum]